MLGFFDLISESEQSIVFESDFTGNLVFEVLEVEDLLELSDGFEELSLERGEEREDFFGVGRGGVEGWKGERVRGLRGDEIGERPTKGSEPMGAVGGEFEEFGGEGGHLEEEGLGAREGWEEGEKGGGGGSCGSWSGSWRRGLLLLLLLLGLGLGVVVVGGEFRGCGVRERRGIRVR